MVWKPLLNIYISNKSSTFALMYNWLDLQSRFFLLHMEGTRSTFDHKVPITTYYSMLQFKMLPWFSSDPKAQLDFMFKMISQPYSQPSSSKYIAGYFQFLKSLFLCWSHFCSMQQLPVKIEINYQCLNEGSVLTSYFRH